jgi:Na+-driven multidrug efflux pump
VLNLALALMLARPFGVEGVAWATPISAMLTSVWGYPWLMKKLIYSKQTQPT